MFLFVEIWLAAAPSGAQITQPSAAEESFRVWLDFFNGLPANTHLAINDTSSSGCKCYGRFRKMGV